MDRRVVYRWESLPEYVATQQYSRCLGRILESLPWWARRRATRLMTRAAVAIGAGIAGLNAELPPPEGLSPEEREMMRAMALEAVDVSREGLDTLAVVPRVSRPDLTAARELLERIEAGVRAGGPPSPAPG